MSGELVDQPDYRPTRKVSLGQFAGGVVTIAAWALDEWSEIKVPLFIGMAVLQIIIFVVQYRVKEKSQ